MSVLPEIKPRQEKHFLSPKEGNGPPKANSFHCERGYKSETLLLSHLQQNLSVELGGISDAKLSHDNQYILLIARKEKVCEWFTHHSSKLPRFLIYCWNKPIYSKSENKFVLKDFVGVDSDEN